MKADPVAQDRLLELAGVDVAIARLRHRRLALPELAQLAETQDQGRRATDELTAAETRVSDAQAAQERAEADLAPVRQRRERNQQQVDAGSIGDPKALSAMVSEIQHLGKRINDLEDVELEAMEELEQATAHRDEVAARRNALVARMRELLAARDTAFGEIDAELRQRASERESLARDVPADLLALYTRIGEKADGVGAAALRGSRCLGCQMEANSADLARYRSAAADDVVRCEECGRILVRPR